MFRSFGWLGDTARLQVMGGGGANRKRLLRGGPEFLGSKQI